MLQLSPPSLQLRSGPSVSSCLHRSRRAQADHSSPHQYGECNQYDGQCKCPAGWGGIDCLTPRSSHLPRFPSSLRTHAPALLPHSVRLSGRRIGAPSTQGRRTLRVRRGLGRSQLQQFVPSPSPLVMLSIVSFRRRGSSIKPSADLSFRSSDSLQDRRRLCWLPDPGVGLLCWRT